MNEEKKNQEQPKREIKELQKSVRQLQTATTPRPPIEEPVKDSPKNKEG